MKRVSPILAGLILISGGLIFTAISVDYSNSIAALVGLTLVLWGGILLYIQPKKHTRVDILQSFYEDMYRNMGLFLEKNGCVDVSVYFSQGSFELLDDVKIRIGKKDDVNNDLILTPPGYTLHKLFERELRINFSSSEINQISKKIEKLITEEFHLAKEVKIYDIEDDIIKVIIKENIFNYNMNDVIMEKIGDPLTSSLACIVARSTGKQITIKDIIKTDNQIEICYQSINYSRGK